MADEENTSLLDDLASAWDEAEAAMPEEEAVAVEEPEVEAPEPITAESEAPVVEAAEEVQQYEQPDEQPDEQPVDASAPPKGLSPAAREAWKDTPDAVKAEITKREQDFSNGIQKYAENARRAEQMDQVLAPYMNLFAMNGGAKNIMPGLLQTAQALQTGSEHVRAQTVASLIEQFGVPIRVLDDILSNSTPQAQSTPQVSVQEQVQQQVQQALQQQRMHEQHGIVQSQLQAFASDPKNEFYKDVSGDMADLLDVAANNGRAMTLEESYSKACNMRDDIRQIIMSRQSHNEVSQRRAAASSISGGPRGHEAPPQPESVSDYLRDAWDRVGNT